MLKKPTLDLNHGFLQVIRRQLEQNAEEAKSPASKSAGSCPPGGRQSTEPSIHHAAYAVTKQASQPANREKTENLLQLARLSNFVPRAQPYIRQAVEEPNQMSEYDITEVCRCLTDRASKQETYTDPAAEIIHHIVQELFREDESVLPAVTAVADEVDKLLPLGFNVQWLDRRLVVHCCTWFLCELARLLSCSQLPSFVIIKSLNATVRTLVEIACESAVDMEVLKLVLEEYGADLVVWLLPEERNELQNILRETFLSRKAITASDSQHLKDILMVIELFAGSFQLNETARKFYLSHSDPPSHTD